MMRKLIAALHSCAQLIAVGFSRLQPRMTMARTLKLYKLPDAPQTPGLRQMRAEDAPQARPCCIRSFALTLMHPRHARHHPSTSPAGDNGDCYDTTTTAKPR